MSVEWVETESKYEISTKDHLLQLMSNGALFTDTGSPPSDYWSVDYVQTTDIDLESDPRISPIGSSFEPFSGGYDGSKYAITDWTFQSSSEDDVGLFGYVSSALLQNIVLEGTWVLSGGSRCGFLVGTATSSSGVYNTSADLSAGFILSSGSEVGGLLGSVSDSFAEGLTMKGLITSISGNDIVGGVVGSVSSGSVLNCCRNMMRFTASPAISGISCSGVCAEVTSSSCSYITNAMVGSLVGIDCTGGVFSIIQSTSAYTISHVSNSMAGTISSTGVSGLAGGLASKIEGDTTVFTMSTMANYMSGDIIGTSTGGVSGSVADGVSINNSVVAMNGSVEFAGVHTITGSNNSVDVQIITGFGLTHTSSGVTNEITGLTGSFGIHEGFDALEYFAVENVDNIGNSYSWEFVFGNVSGSVDYSNYTHLVISSGDICGPIELQVNLPDNSVEYLYKMNIGTNEVEANPGLNIIYSSGVVFDTFQTILFPIPPLVVSITSPFSLTLAWEEIESATTYRITYTSGVTGVTQSQTSTTPSIVILNLEPSTTYNFQMHYSLDGTNFMLEPDVIGSTTLPANDASGYVLSAFLQDDIYDFSGFSPDKAGQLAVLINDLLGQDESVKLYLNGSVQELLVSGLSGGSIGTTDGDQYILPFQQSGGPGQSISTSGVYEGGLVYDESLNGITINGVTYTPGESVVVDNIRITVKTI